MVVETTCTFTVVCITGTDADKNAVCLFLCGLPFAKAIFRDLDGLLTFAGISRAILLEELSTSVLAWSLVTLIILKVLSVAHAWGTKPLSKRVDLDPKDTASPWWSHAAHALFGRRLWKAHVP